MLEFIGYASIPDNAQTAGGLLRDFFIWILSLPWWVPWGFTTLVTLGLIIFSWPRRNTLVPEEVPHENLSVNNESNLNSVGGQSHTEPPLGHFGLLRIDSERMDSGPNQGGPRQYLKLSVPFILNRDIASCLVVVKAISASSSGGSYAGRREYSWREQIDGRQFSGDAIAVVLAYMSTQKNHPNCYGDFQPSKSSFSGGDHVITIKISTPEQVELYTKIFLLRVPTRQHGYVYETGQSIPGDLFFVQEDGFPLFDRTLIENASEGVKRSSLGPMGFPT